MYIILAAIQNPVTSFFYPIATYSPITCFLSRSFQPAAGYIACYLRGHFLIEMAMIFFGGLHELPSFSKIPQKQSQHLSKLSRTQKSSKIHRTIRPTFRVPEELGKNPTGWGPPVISLFITPSKYSYKYHTLWLL